MLGVAAAEHVEVDAVQDLDPVVGRRRHPLATQLLHRRPDPILDRPARRPRPRPGAEQSTKPSPSAVASCRASIAASTSSTSRPPRRAPSAARGARAASRDLVAKLVGAREPQRRQQAEADRLAVAVAPVSGRRLDRVPDRVAEVERLAAAGVALVGGDDRELGPRAGEDHARRARRVERVDRPHPLPERVRRRSAPS